MQKEGRRYKRIWGFDKKMKSDDETKEGKRKEQKRKNCCEKYNWRKIWFLER